VPLVGAPAAAAPGRPQGGQGGQGGTQFSKAQENRPVNF